MERIEDLRLEEETRLSDQCFVVDDLHATYDTRLDFGLVGDLSVTWLRAQGMRS